jgi:hypothetical protein
MTFSLEVSYAQLAVFDARLANPFNDWSDEHVSQGFSWRPGSVSFATLDPDGTINVDVSRAKASPSGDSPARAIQVPFRVPSHGEIEVATISDSFSLELAAGEYALTFAHGRSPSGQMWATLNFGPVEVTVRAHIIVADDEMKPPAELVMTAVPAYHPGSH